jgi:hypothetical protein
MPSAELTSVMNRRHRKTSYDWTLSVLARKLCDLAHDCD